MAIDYEALAKQYGGASAAQPAATDQAQAAAPTPQPAQAQPTGQQPAPDLAALATQFGGSAQPQEMGVLESLGEMVTGERRATEATRTLQDWTELPELSDMSVAQFKTALGTMLSNPRETAQIVKANFPGVEVRQDEKGNFILKSAVDQREYAIKPGFTPSDIPRAVGGLLAFTPAGRAVTIPGAVAAGAGTQAAIEATQMGTGGQFATGEVGMAGALGGAGQVLQRAIQATGAAARQAAGRMAGQPAAAGPVTTAAQAVPEQQAAQAAQAAAPGAPAAAAQAVEESATDILNIARKAAGFGPGSSAAKAKLTDLAQVNPEARAAAERLGIDLPVDVFSDNPQVRSAVGLTRALVGSETEAVWENTVRQAVQRADDISKQFDAAFIEGRPATGATSQKILDSLKNTQSQLASDAKAIYDRVDATVPKQSTVQFPKLTQTLDEVLSEVGESGLTSQEKRLYELATDPAATYGRLLREKNLIGKALEGKESPYGNLDAGSLKRLYGALADDQLANVGSIGGEELRRELRAANLLTAKKKGLEKRIVGAFGKEVDGSVAQRMQTAITTAAKGDAAVFNKLMKVVPEDLRKETIATALASVTAGKAAGRAAGAGEVVFSPAEYSKIYRGLRANPPVYSAMVKIMGSEWDRASRDLYEVSRRISDAQARIPTTGKANQILGEAAVDGLMGKIMSSGIGQRVATGVVGTLPGGGVIAPDIVQWMAATKGAGVQKAAKLFASPEFQDLAVQAATKAGNPSQAAIKRTATSKAFSEFAKAAKLPQSLDARVQWLQSALQTGRQFQQETQQ